MNDTPGTILPNDEHNRELVSMLHPDNYRNPKPADRYDLVVIGAGPAGLVTAAGAAGLGARVALVEAHLMGGDCLNVGCVPSKSLIASARAAHDARNAERFGVRIKGEIEVDFGAVMERMRRLRAGISHHDSVARYTELGVDVFLGRAEFKDETSITVEDRAGEETVLSFRKAVIATGTRPFIPEISGLNDTGYLTNETVFSLTELPKRLAVLGGGPIGSELAQAFRRFGSEIELIHRGSHILNREDKGAAEIVQGAFIREGISLILNATITAAERTESGIRLQISQPDGETAIDADALLIATGRAPNVKGMALEKAGVKYDPHTGVEVDDRLRTANPHIFAAGDVASRYRFTHAADAMARIVIQNALFMGRKRVSDLVMPWCTYTDPEIGHIGRYPHELDQEGIPYQTFTIPFSEVDRAVADGETEGFVKVHTGKKRDRILGATIVNRKAGDMIGEFSAAIAGGAGLAALAKAIHPYPTQAEAIKRSGDAWSRSRLTPFTAKLLKKWIEWWR